MKHLLIALVITVGLVFAPLAQAMCKDADCAVELMKTEKDAPAKAVHVCDCHHHSSSGIELPAAGITAHQAVPQAVIAAPVSPMASAIISPLLEPPLHA